MMISEEQCPIHLSPHPTHALVLCDNLRAQSQIGEDVDVEGATKLAENMLRSLILAKVTEIMF